MRPPPGEDIGSNKEWQPSQSRRLTRYVGCDEVTATGAYRADFYYFDKKQGKWVVEDAKGVKTDVYKMKKKLMLSVHGLEIMEV